MVSVCNCIIKMQPKKIKNKRHVYILISRELINFSFTIGVVEYRYSSTFELLATGSKYSILFEILSQHDSPSRGRPQTRPAGRSNGGAWLHIRWCYRGILSRAMCCPDVGDVRRYLTFHRSPFGSRVNRGLRGWPRSKVRCGCSRPNDFQYI